MTKKKGYMKFAKVRAQEKHDEDFRMFFQCFRQVDKEGNYLYKPYVGEIVYEDENGKEDLVQIKAISIIDVDNRCAVFQLICQQPFFHKQEMDMLNEMYQHFLEETEEQSSSVERC